MKMDIVAWSSNDEFYSPRYAILPILKYLRMNSSIWCPFDTEDSNFVKLLKERWHRVYYTHKDILIKNIDTYWDFFNNDVFSFVDKEVFLKAWEGWMSYTWWIDYIISNPPYSIKWDVLKRLFNIWKPFAMLVWVVWLFESKERFEMFKNNKFEIMYMDKRVSYFKDFNEQKPSLNPPFSSVFLCSWILHQQITFEYIIKNNQ